MIAYFSPTLASLALYNEAHASTASPSRRPSWSVQAVAQRLSGVLSGCKALFSGWNASKASQS